MTISRIAAVGALLVLGACGPSSAPSDLGADGPACMLGVELAPGGATPFAPFHDGDVAAVLIGFQGFQMLSLDVRLTGVPAGATVNFSAHLVVADTGVEAGHAARALDTVPAGDALLVPGFLLFFNSAPLSQVQGHDADLELVVHAGPCAGGARVRLHLSDQPPCLDPDASVPDAGILDAAIPDGTVVCGMH